MKRPPAKFFEQYQAFRTRWDWAERGLEAGDVVQAKLTVADMRAFVERWQGRIGIAELEGALALMREQVDRIEAVLALKQTEDLLALLEVRRVWLVEQGLAKAALPLLEIMKTAPTPLRPGLEQIFRESHGYDFDAERFFREGEAALEKCEADYRKALATMESNWPEWMTAATRQRLDAADSGAAIDQWRAELLAG